MTINRGQSPIKSTKTRFYGIKNGILIRDSHLFNCYYCESPLIYFLLACCRSLFSSVGLLVVALVFGLLIFRVYLNTNP